MKVDPPALREMPAASIALGVRGARTLGRFLSLVLGSLLISLITLYRGLSAVTPASCRFDPTCSAYSIEAIRLHGPIKGGCLALRRMVRCHPWGGCGYDPVPPRAERDESALAAEEDSARAGGQRLHPLRRGVAS